MAEFKHALGARVRDKISGFEGIVYGRTEWLYGCLGYEVISDKLTKEEKPGEYITFDEGRLEVIEQVHDDEEPPPGGPGQSPGRDHR